MSGAVIVNLLGVIERCRQCRGCRDWGIMPTTPEAHCPQGKLADLVTTLPARTAPTEHVADLGKMVDLPAGAEAACHACTRPGCANVTICCGGQVSIHIVGPCPDDPPRW